MKLKFINLFGYIFINQKTKIGLAWKNNNTSNLAAKLKKKFKQERQMGKRMAGSTLYYCKSNAMDC